MGYIERVTWSQVIVSAPVGIAYFLIVLPQLAGTSPDDIDWITPMLWSIGRHRGVHRPQHRLGHRRRPG